MLSRDACSAVTLLLENPLQVARWMGFDKLTGLHNRWITGFLTARADQTLLAHRGSYKTTCLSVAIAIHLVLRPERNIIFLRKTDDDTAEIITQVKKMLTGDVFACLTAKIYGQSVRLLKTGAGEITTDLAHSVRGAAGLTGLGIKASLTGKHADLIITDDIVNLRDRVSFAEREFTRQVYFELQNVKNRGGRFINTGTPWHPGDCISSMPNVSRFDCYSTGLISPDELAGLRASISPPLFAANYELRHIASGQALFAEPPRFTAEAGCLAGGFAHIDAAYSGADSCAMTLGRRGKDAQGNDVFYLLGVRRSGHIDSCLPELLSIKNRFGCGSVIVESNADKGYLAKLIASMGEIACGYHESMNKFIKISTYLRGSWPKIIFHAATDPDYINEILDYTEDAAHDDCPDSCASLIQRRLERKSGVVGLL